MSNEERRSEIKRRNICLFCGFQRTTKTNRDPKSHKCRKFHEDIRCKGNYNGGNCTYNGLTCFHKKVDISTKQKIKNKLKVDLEGYPTVIPKVLESPTFKEDAYPSRNGTNNIQSRVKDLQLGEVCKDMTNAEVLDFFTYLLLCTINM